MSKSWEEMSKDEKLELLKEQMTRLLSEMSHKNNQVASLQLTVNEIGNAVREIERKLGSNK